jgi:hypothetical protein
VPHDLLNTSISYWNIERCILMTDPKTPTVPTPNPQVEEKTKATPAAEPAAQPGKATPAATPAQQS